MSFSVGKKMRKGIVLGLVALLILAMTGAAYAGTTSVSYSTTVGRIGGSGYTSYQTKTTKGASGSLSSTGTGGYVLKARMVDSDGDAGEWTSDFTDSASRTLSSNDYHTAGESVRVQLKNKYVTTVQVQATGSWKSN